MERIVRFACLHRQIGVGDKDARIIYTEITVVFRIQ